MVEGIARWVDGFVFNMGRYGYVYVDHKLFQIGDTNVCISNDQPH